MLFNSLTFLLFLLAVLLLHAVPLPWRVRKANLLLASYVFYAAWNPPFVLLLWISTVVDWIAARGLGRARTTTARRLLLALSLATNLGLLGFFKYAQFLLENFQQLAGLAGIAFEPAAADIVLPVGISFYTFQTLSYTIDVYRGAMRPWPSFLDYALYVSFFPQLVAGPIVRAREWLPQCREPKRVSADQAGWGLSLLAIGLFQKAVLADALLAPVADSVYGAAALATPIEAWAGTLAFAGQIFCDFSGYSTCAIGVALCLGFRIPPNFRFPYAAEGFSDFWRRWHISLSTWLRDYVYVPLGGNRRGTPQTYVNLFFTMLVGGLWHGAAWHFVAWGAFHGLLLALERPRRRLTPGSGLPLVRMALTFLVVTAAWSLFRAENLADAIAVLGSMAGSGGTGAGVAASRMAGAVAVTGTLVLGQWALRGASLEAAVTRLPWWVRGTALAAILLALATIPGENRAFIYFQF
jgi:alginate O-acetyltransferase complex protein AlgI